MANIRISEATTKTPIVGTEQIPLEAVGDTTPYKTTIDAIVGHIPNAVADGATKGVAAFAANDFDSASGVISIDYANGQTSGSGSKGFLTAADWNTFDAKQPAGAYLTGVTADSPLSGAGTALSHLVVDLSSKLGVNAQAADSALLEGHPASYFQSSGSYISGVVVTSPLGGDGTSGSPLTVDLSSRVAVNVTIIPATKTKIAYDAKGLVTSGADATTADIADSFDRRYVTDANLVVIGNTSGSNSGDQVVPVTEAGAANNFLTAYNATSGAFSKARPTWADVDKGTSSIADITTRSHTLLSDIGTNTHSQIDIDLARLSSTSGSNSGDQTLAGLGAEAVANKVTSISGSSTDVQYPSAKLLYDQLALKQGAGAYLTGVAVNAPLTGSGTSGSPLTIPAASSGSNGYLTSADWATFNAKQPAGAYLTGVTADSPLSGSGTAGSHLVVDLSGRQAVNANLTSVSGLTWSSGSAFVKMTGANTFTLDTNSYLTSLSGALLADGSIVGAVSQSQLFTTGVGVNVAVPLTKFHVVDTISTSPRGILSMQLSNDTNGAREGFAKARWTGGTYPTGSMTTVVTGDMLGRLMFRGYDGTNYLEMASIDVGTFGAIALTRVPTYIAISVGTNATPSVLTEMVRVTPTGVGIGTTSPGYSLEIQTPASSVNALYIHPTVGSGSVYPKIVMDRTTSGGGLSPEGSITAEQMGFVIRSLGSGAVVLNPNVASSKYAGVNIPDAGNLPGSMFSINGNFAVGPTFYKVAAHVGGAIIEGDVGIGTTLPLTKVHAVNTSATTNAILEVMRIEAQVTSTGVGATGFGPAFTMYGESSIDTAYRQMAQIETSYVVATDASRTTRGRWLQYDAGGAREIMRGETSGSLPMWGVLGHAAQLLPAAYTLAGTVTRTFPADPSVAYSGIDNLQMGTVYAQLTDLNTLRGVVSSLEGVVRQLITDTNGYGLTQ